MNSTIRRAPPRMSRTAAVKPGVATGLGYAERSPGSGGALHAGLHPRPQHLPHHPSAGAAAGARAHSRPGTSRCSDAATPPPTQEVDGFRIVGQQLTALPHHFP